MCYAICALAMDLIWGYTGILSLGHGLFFALGGYAMGMYLMRQIGRDGQYQSDMPDFMVFLELEGIALALGASATASSPDAAGGAGAGAAGLRVRLLRLPLAHQGRVLLDHHAGDDLRRDAAVLPQRDRLRRQQRLHRLQAHPRHPDRHAVDAHGAVRAHRPHADRLLRASRAGWWPASSAACCRPSATPRAASCSPATTRSRYKLTIWVHLGGDVRHRRRALRAAGGHHQPGRDERRRPASRSRSGRRWAGAAR